MSCNNSKGQQERILDVPGGTTGVKDDSNNHENNVEVQIENRCDTRIIK